MIVLKFGGTSVGNAENIKKVAKIVTSYKQDKIVVLSAVSGTTNTLVKINELIADENLDQVQQTIYELELSYHTIINELFDSEFYELKALQYVKEKFDFLRSIAYSILNDKIILAQGEILSTNIFKLYLESLDIEAKLLDSLEFMSIDENSEPNTTQIRQKLTEILQEKSNIHIAQGYICRNHEDRVDNLKRGGSDYTASLIGAAIKADEIQIWTDISGMHNNDPRYVDSTYPIEEISFDEAAELAYFGAKILHPQSVIPAKENNIPVLLKNTFKPEDKGTVIKNCETPEHSVRAIAAKDNIIAIKIKSYRMLMAYGFLKRVFEIFEKYKTSIDMITTSEVAVSLTIDDETHLEKIIEELQEFSKVTVDKNMSIVCLAGDFSQDKSGITAKVMNALRNISLRMISYGGSDYNTSILIDTKDKIEALNALNEGVFEQETAELI